MDKEALLCRNQTPLPFWMFFTLLRDKEGQYSCGLVFSRASGCALQWDLTLTVSFIHLRPGEWTGRPQILQYQCHFWLCCLLFLPLYRFFGGLRIPSSSPLGQTLSSPPSVPALPGCPWPQHRTVAVSLPFTPQCACLSSHCQSVLLHSSAVEAVGRFQNAPA